MDEELFLPGVPATAIRAAYSAAPGNEIDSGKFGSPESSAALVGNAFGIFLDRPETLPPQPGTSDGGWPARSVTLETIVRLPWAGGHHPCLDVLIVTGSALIGIESKRYEPFRVKTPAEISDAYSRDVWGSQMARYARCRDGLRDRSLTFAHLDAAQLVKHAFGLRTAVHRVPAWSGLKPILYYLFAEPEHWPGDKGPVAAADRARHRAEIETFSEMTAGDEVSFRFCSYSELLSDWAAQPNPEVAAHADAVGRGFLSR